ncbi:Hypothetical protein LUCI_0549 [Lucifera butyrica]|uniref:Uncharacterized protein n=1 Tax=Lucifera butyrica TaxID=1351585 RepID=A0A498R504_9FIRM|nr:hypothetical protein [Lucifera butyrica]VBB05342.1 Hypothetical protein LUCI_0549 [Lucifera butyrica]
MTLPYFDFIAQWFVRLVHNEWFLGLLLISFILFLSMRSVFRAKRMMEKLVKNGVVAVARINHLEQTGTFINNQPELKIQATAYPRNQAPVQLEIKQVITLISLPQVQVGSQVIVAYNPSRPAQAVILGEKYINKMNLNELLPGPSGTETPQTSELATLLTNLASPPPEKPQGVNTPSIDPFGEKKGREFARVLRVVDTGQNVNGHPVQSVHLQITPRNGQSWEALLTLLAPCFCPYESGEIVEVVFDYANSQGTIGILSRSPDYKLDSRSKFHNISQAVYRLLTIERSGYYAGTAEFLFIKAQAAFAGNVIDVEIVMPEPKGIRLQPNMTVSSFCWRDDFEKSARLQKQKRGIARVDSVEITRLFWGQNPVVRINVTLEEDGSAALLEEPMHTLHIPEIGKHIFVAYSPMTKEATLLGSKI